MNSRTALCGRSWLVVVAIALTGALALSGCDSAGPQSPASLQVVPATATVQVGQTQQFEVAGFAASEVTWSVDPSSAGGIDAGGRFTATMVPAGGMCTVVARLKSDASRAGLATVMITAAAVTSSYPSGTVIATGGLQAAGSVQVQSVVQEVSAPTTSTNTSGSMTIRSGFLPVGEAMSP